MSGDYYPVVWRAVNKLPLPTAAARQEVYQRARHALLQQLRNCQPPVSEAAIAIERQALDRAISLVEAEFDLSTAKPASFVAGRRGALIAVSITTLIAGALGFELHTYLQGADRTSEQPRMEAVAKPEAPPIAARPIETSQEAETLKEEEETLKETEEMSLPLPRVGIDLGCQTEHKCDVGVALGAAQAPVARGTVSSDSSGGEQVGSEHRTSLSEPGEQSEEPAAETPGAEAPAVAAPPSEEADEVGSTLQPSNTSALVEKPKPKKKPRPPLPPRREDAPRPEPSLWELFLRGFQSPETP
jgi:hypothetical protein